jgi:hypothetical protein
VSLVNIETSPEAHEASFRRGYTFFDVEAKETAQEELEWLPNSG